MSWVSEVFYHLQRNNNKENGVLENVCFNDSSDYVPILWKQKHYETDAERNYYISESEIDVDLVKAPGLLEQRIMTETFKMKDETFKGFP